MLRRRDIGFLAAGLVVGLLVATLVLSSSDALRTSLFGTAGLRATAKPAYFLVDMDQSREWLTETFPSEEEDLADAFTNVAILSTAERLGPAIREVQTDIDYVVGRAFTALTGIVPEELDLPELQDEFEPLLASVADGPVSTCLAIEQNPYNIDVAETGAFPLYLYLTVPETQIGGFPETWEQLETPREGDLYWQLLACEETSSGQGQRSR